ncbi:hypothetical protein [Hirschia maritima]|uniref:hypothetical protein n=1 Tax=Hirschia maritima TaxID=1121961 RepID=UPI0003603D70|nr:hypothetical protein [Hirschia maritima]
MAVFRCFIKGIDFPGSVIGKNESVLYGFYTTRLVTASSYEEAELLAVDMIWDQNILDCLWEKKFKPTPRLVVEKIDEVRAVVKVGPNSGATWFEQEYDGSEPFHKED